MTLCATQPQSEPVLLIIVCSTAREPTCNTYPLCSIARGRAYTTYLCVQPSQWASLYYLPLCAAQPESESILLTLVCSTARERTYTTYPCVQHSQRANLYHLPLCASQLESEPKQLTIVLVTMCAVLPEGGPILLALMYSTVRGRTYTTYPCVQHSQRAKLYFLHLCAAQPVGEPILFIFVCGTARGRTCTTYPCVQHSQRASLYSYTSVLHSQRASLYYLSLCAANQR